MHYLLAATPSVTSKESLSPFGPVAASVSFCPVSILSSELLLSFLLGSQSSFPVTLLSWNSSPTLYQLELAGHRDIPPAVYFVSYLLF